MVGPDGTLPLPWLDEPLARLLAAARAHHALLLHGPSGVGQFELATTLAQAWLCEADDDAGRRPCGRCAACRLVQSRGHPDLLVVLPEMLQSALGWSPGDEDEGSEGSRERKPKKDIVVEQVRRVVAFAQLSASRGRGKVVLIHPAERMNGIAANTLLKTLEEPPGDARFVLATGAPQALLPTIRSRCQPHLLPAPPAGIAAAWLAGQGIDRPEVLLAGTGGRPLEARAWAAEGLGADAWLRLPAAVAAGHSAAFAGWPLPRVVDALGRLCHDAMLAAAGIAPRFFERVPATASPAALQRWAGELRRAAAQAEHPLNLPLAVESLVLQARRALEPARAGGALDYTAAP